MIYSSNGQGLKEAIFSVYGAECVSHCLEVSMYREGLRVYGYIGDPQYTKANKTYQTLAVNGRYIMDQNIAGAIMQAFRQYLMKRQYPFYVLHVELPYDEVDVNVHPKKQEVRFANLNRVCSTFYHGVEKALDDYKAHSFEKVMPMVQPQETPKLEQQEFLTRINETMTQMDETNLDQRLDIEAMEEATMREEYKTSFDKIAEQIEREVTVEKARHYIGLDNPENFKHSSITIQSEKYNPPQELTEAEKLMFRTRILGVAFKTYLILEIDDKFILVDQHAAHERILFDKFMAQQTGDMQPVLFPYVFTVKEDEAVFIDENIDNIYAAGIQIESFGRNTYRIVAVSTLLADTQMDNFVQFLLGSIDDYKIDDKTLIVEKIAQKACKAAVKAGYRLNEYEIKYIVSEVYNNKILQCPHGRPITVVLTKTQIEKMFKRIV